MTRRLWIIVPLALLAAACQGVQPILAPAGPEARTLADLGWLALVAFSVVSILMWGLMLLLWRRPQGTLAEHAPWDAANDKRWIYVGGLAIPAVILIVLFVATLRTMAAFPMGNHEMEMGTPDITVTGHQWWWEVEYRVGGTRERFVTANELHVPAGQPVDIELQTRDVIHSFWVPRLHGKVDLVPGFVNRIRIQADEPGRFHGQCSDTADRSTRTCCSSSSPNDPRTSARGSPTSASRHRRRPPRRRPAGSRSS